MEDAKKAIPWNEVANAVTHGLGTGLAVAALVLLTVYAALYGNAWHIVSFSIYGATLVPVSYTHLDVYKRQLYRRPGDIPPGAVWPGSSICCPAQ